MTAEMLLSIHGARKAYGSTVVLHDVSLDLRAGEVHALMGENGAGKSTLIKILAGVIAADAVEMRLRGKPIAIRSAAEAAVQGLRFIHQELNIVPALSVAENIYLSSVYPRRLGMFVDWRRLRRETERLLTALGIDHLHPDRVMARLSPGDQMLVKIAAAFVGSEDDAQSLSTPGIYVMDEPTAALSRGETELLFRVIGRLRERGNAVLYVSHRMEDIFRICDRVTVMRDGYVVLDEAVKKVNADTLIHAMTGRQLANVFPPRETPVEDRMRLRVRDLTTDKLQPLSFHIHAGEIVGVAGLTGSGRTELLRALLRADRVRAGNITLDDAPLTHRSPAGAWRAGVAFVPEERRAQAVIGSHRIDHNIVFPHLDVFSHTRAFVHREREQTMARSLGDSVRLRARGIDQHVRQLSGGNQQKIVFARALAGKPRLLLLDEPTRGVDVGAKFDLYTLIRQISAGGAAILLASSDLPELIGLCDRLLILRGGRWVGDVPTRGLTEAALLALCYGELEHAGK